MKPGDVVVAAFPGAQGTKTRPAVVLSSSQYQGLRPDVVLGLITSKTPTRMGATDYALLDWVGAGLHMPSVFRTYVVTRQQNEVRVIGRLTPRDWRGVRFCFRTAFAEALAES